MQCAKKLDIFYVFKLLYFTNYDKYRSFFIFMIPVYARIYREFAETRKKNSTRTNLLKIVPKLLTFSVEYDIIISSKTK